MLSFLKGFHVKVYKIDIGRLIVLPIFTLILIINFLNIYKDFKALLPINMIKVFGLTYHLLFVCFYVLIILLYFLRVSAISTSKSFITNTIAVIATLLPFTLPLLSKVPLVNPGRILAADLIIISGISFSIYALSTLGRNISIIPQARKLVKSGPYRFVRHPLYLSELISVFGFVLGEITLSRIIIFLLLIVLQVYRAFQEEKLLAGIFPEYKEYCSETARFIPGIF